MPNHGAISNLPRNAIVEVPTMVDRSGLRLATVGELPPQLVGYMQPHVTQQELFIRAATEGRRDHVYQAALFDPLTAATLPPDKIVELCDELIAAHGLAKDGGCLPDLDAKRTLVPTSGKAFGRVDAKRAAQQLGRRPGQGRRGPPAALARRRPVQGPQADRRRPAVRTPVEDDYAERPDGTVDLTATFPSGDATVRWTPATAAAKNGFVDLGRDLGPADHAVAYAYAEVDAIHPRETVLRCGSDRRASKSGSTARSSTPTTPPAATTPATTRPPSTSAPAPTACWSRSPTTKSKWGFGLAVPRPTS